ncbi:MoaD/ThiS family protein [Chloroflexota bacterium]
MSVKISIPSGLQHITREQEVVEVNGSTVGECLNHLARQFPGIEKELLDEDGKVFQYVDIYVNGESSYPEELAKPVKDGDELYMLRAVAGG